MNEDLYKFASSCRTDMKTYKRLEHKSFCIIQFRINLFGYYWCFKVNQEVVFDLMFFFYVNKQYQDSYISYQSSFNLHMDFVFVLSIVRRAETIMICEYAKYLDTLWYMWILWAHGE